ncbi:MAG TPA: hypothetical protein VGP99_04530 [Tepidisphaeraceae bacterium]|nr:hypothetical protein [Tepidisphaeraceae bacterium]
MSGIPADDFHTLRGEPALPAPVGRLHFAFGFLAGIISRLFRSREARRQEAMERWSAQWRKWVARIMSGNTQSFDAAAPSSIAPLQQPLTGKSRADVVVTLGPPPGTSSAETNKLGTRHYWHADTWYYPLDLNRRHAIAITFHENQVKSIERFTGPPH